MLIGPELAGVLQLSPSDNILSWVLLGVGLFLGFFFKFKLKLESLLLAVCLYLINRDFQIPQDMVLITGLPICMLNWTQHNVLQFVLFIITMVSFPFSTSINVPHHDWLPALHAAFYIGNQDTFRTKLCGSVLVVLRHFVQVKSYFLYGSLIFCKSNSSHSNNIDNTLRETSTIVLFFFLNNEAWFIYFLPCALVSYSIYKQYNF